MEDMQVHLSIIAQLEAPPVNVHVIQAGDGLQPVDMPTDTRLALQTVALGLRQDSKTFFVYANPDSALRMLRMQIKQTIPMFVKVCQYSAVHDALRQYKKKHGVVIEQIAVADYDELGRLSLHKYWIDNNIKLED